MAEAKRINYINEIRKYYADEFTKLLNIGCINNNLIKDYLTAGKYIEYSHYNRIVLSLQLLKYCYLFPKTELVTIIFKATLGPSAIYAIVYGIPKQTNISIDYKYVCFGGTRQSQDGEYRNGMIMWRQYLFLADSYKTELANIEDKVLNLLNDNILELRTEFFFPDITTDNQSAIENTINDSRLAIQLLCMCVLRDANMTMTNHILPNYTTIIDSIDYKTTEEISQHIYYFCMSPTEKHLHLQVGQKISPMCVLEMAKPNDILYDNWRELYISNKAASLVINMISPSFSVLAGWFYINNSHAGMFDNLSMHEKYKFSETAKLISNMLKNVNEINYVDDIPLSPKFSKISKNIYNTLLYVDGEIKIADVAICMISEFVGPTIRDLPLLISQSDDYNIFLNDDIFAKYYFELIYAIYCLHTKISVIHADLHVNNITLNRFYKSADHRQYFKGEPSIGFIIDQDVYSFKHTGSYATIIDFSRAIIGDINSIKYDFGKQYANNYNMIRSNKLISFIKNYIEEIDSSIKCDYLHTIDYMKLFKIASAIDLLSLQKSVKYVATMQNYNIPKKYDLSFLETNLLNNLQNITSNNEIEWPALSCLKLFSDYLVTNHKSEVMMELFNYNNDVQYNFDSYDNWGPLLKIDKEIELRKKYDQELYEDIKNWINYKSMDETKELEKIKNKHIIMEKHLLEHQDWMFI